MKINENLRKVIEMSSLILHEGSFIYGKVKTAPVVGNHFLVTQDADEITVVTKKENIGQLDLIEKSTEDRSLLEIKFSANSPDATGFLALISSALAEQEMSISVISTYSKDYFLVSQKDTEKAINVFTGLGFQKL